VFALLFLQRIKFESVERNLKTKKQTGFLIFKT